MGKIAFVFSGQGDQYPGMGKELYNRYPVAKAIFSMCDELRPGTSAQCFEGTEEELLETKNTQPCLFAVELAAAAALMQNGVLPDIAAGFSLGEMTAATVCGLFDNKTGFHLVCRRGELMQREAERFDTSMAAILKLTPAQVRELCSRYSGIYPVNYNCPGQITVSGAASQMLAFFKDVKAFGGRALPLKVKGAFHSPVMEEAARAFAKELSGVMVKERTDRLPVKLYSDLTAEPYTDDIINLLSRQISSPVQWEKLVQNMILDGADTFIEIGPGRTLTGMINKIDPSVTARTVFEYLPEKSSL